MVMMGFVAGQGACGRSGCSKALDSIALGLRQGTTPQAASRPAPLQGSHHNHKVRYRLPLEGKVGEGWFLAQSLINGICDWAHPAARGLAALLYSYQQKTCNLYAPPGRWGRRPLRHSKFNCVPILRFRQGGIPRPTGLANISPNPCPQMQKCRSRLLHLLRHFYLGVNGLGYSSLFRLWDYCRTPVFLSK